MGKTISSGTSSVSIEVDGVKISEIMGKKTGGAALAGYTKDCYEGIINELSQRLLEAHMSVIALLLNAGGTVTVTEDQAKEVSNYKLETSSSDKEFTFRAVRR